MPNDPAAAEPRDLRSHTTTEGFTLLEVLIVVAIMLIIVATAIPRITPMLQAAHKTTIVAKLRTLTNELSAYRMNCGGHPNSLAALKPSPEKGCSKSSAAASDPVAASGYRLTYAASNRDESGHYEGYTLTAVPSSPHSAGNESYSTNQTGIIRVHGGGQVAASGPAFTP
jgi:prepilin-type N-terminal cleavage/methylation domain-containing protein